MKYVVVLGDGMADRPIEEIGGKTPLEYADTPVMDKLAKMSEIGLSANIPDGMKPGSDTANLAVLGYNPEKYYTGRSPLEALSIGVDMEDTDIALRCNIVTLSDDDRAYEEKIITDHSSGEISTGEAAELIEAVKRELQDEIYRYYVGTSYRHLTIWKNGTVKELTPPHDILGKVIGSYLPEDEKLRTFMKRSYDILNNHPINIARAEKGLNKANSIWFWGAGTKPALASFEKKYGKKGAMISAVDLLKGIAVGTGMTNIIVEGADGTLETNYEGKARAAVKAVTEDGFDYVYVHVEAPDEMEIADDDIRIDTYRSSGAGGQHINKTSSAIRITHYPTGIVVQCQNERSQHMNKDKAMQMLKAKLYILKQQENQALQDDIRGDVTEIGWGNQIRSYVMQPYTMVKDHRTNEETGNVNAVMDGDIDIFINGYLKWINTGKQD